MLWPLTEHRRQKVKHTCHFIYAVRCVTSMGMWSDPLGGLHNNGLASKHANSRRPVGSASILVKLCQTVQDHRHLTGVFLEADISTAIQQLTCCIKLKCTHFSTQMLPTLQRKARSKGKPELLRRIRICCYALGLTLKIRCYGNQCVWCVKYRCNRNGQTWDKVDWGKDRRRKSERWTEIKEKR